MAGTGNPPVQVCQVTLFDNYVAASTFKQVLQCYRSICVGLELDPTDHNSFYNGLKAKLTSWKAQKLWALLDKRLAHKEYRKQKVAQNLQVLIIGAGPCGLRAGIESCCLGAKTVIIEKRDRFSRNNVLHIWPFVIHDLKSLGAKLFYPKFCAGAIDHISIRQLQCLLLKIVLLLGAEVHENCSFEELLEPERIQSSDATLGWRARLNPANHVVADFEFNVLVGADGKRNTVPGFRRKEFRGKLAIGITANFINRRSQAEEGVQEISGVAFIFNQSFFKDLKSQTGIDLENIVYYKDDTHYFVMCAKKQSLLEKGVIIFDYDDVDSLLSPGNVNQECLLQYAREAADFSTNGDLPRLDYALNHFGQPDVAMFDFTSLFSAEHASRIFEKLGNQLLVGIVGDSLHEPFWPTGSGCARGFLSCLDSAWMMRSFAIGKLTFLEMIAQREAVYRMLAQTTPELLHKTFSKYTIDPSTRYQTAEASTTAHTRGYAGPGLKPFQVADLFTSDDPTSLELMLNHHHHGGGSSMGRLPTTLSKRPKRESDYARQVAVVQWCQAMVTPYKLRVDNVTTSLRSGLVLAALVHRFRPDLLDYWSLDPKDCTGNVMRVMDVMEKEFGILPLPQLVHGMTVTPEQKMLVVDYIVSFQKALKSSAVNDENAPTSVISAVLDGTPTAGTTKPFLVLPAKRKMPPSSSNRASSGSMMVEEDDAAIRKRHELRLRRLQMQEENLDDLLGSKIQSAGGDGTPNKLGPSRQQPSPQEMMSIYKTKRPGLIEKLNPDRLAIVEQLIKDAMTGNVKRMQSGADSSKGSTLKARKLDAKEIEEMEQKLQDTVMGRLMKQHVPEKPYSTKDAKLIAAKTSAMRERAQKGFQQEPVFPELEKRLKEVDDRQKRGPSSGLSSVSSLAQAHALKLSNMSASSADGNASQVFSTPPTTPLALSSRASTPSSGQPPRVPPPVPPKKSPSKAAFVPAEGGNTKCCICDKTTYFNERLCVEGRYLHKGCFRCAFCDTALRLNAYGCDRAIPGFPGDYYFCMAHLRAPWEEKAEKLRLKNGSMDEDSLPFLRPSTPASAADFGGAMAPNGNGAATPLSTGGSSSGHLPPALPPKISLVYTPPPTPPKPIAKVAPAPLSPSYMATSPPVFDGGHIAISSANSGASNSLVRRTPTKSGSSISTPERAEWENTLRRRNPGEAPKAVIEDDLDLDVDMDDHAQLEIEEDIIDEVNQTFSSIDIDEILSNGDSERLNGGTIVGDKIAAKFADDDDDVDDDDDKENLANLLGLGDNKRKLGDTDGDYDDDDDEDDLSESEVAQLEAALNSGGGTLSSEAAAMLAANFKRHKSRDLLAGSGSDDEDTEQEMDSSSADSYGENENTFVEIATNPASPSAAGRCRSPDRLGLRPRVSDGSPKLTRYARKHNLRQRPRPKSAVFSPTMGTIESMITAASATPSSGAKQLSKTGRSNTDLDLRFADDDSKPSSVEVSPEKPPATVIGHERGGRGDKSLSVAKPNGDRLNTPFVEKIARHFRRASPTSTNSPTVPATDLDISGKTKGENESESGQFQSVAVKPSSLPGVNASGKSGVTPSAKVTGVPRSPTSPPVPIGGANSAGVRSSAPPSVASSPLQQMKADEYRRVKEDARRRAKLKSDIELGFVSSNPGTPPTSRAIADFRLSEPFIATDAITNGMGESGAFAINRARSVSFDRRKLLGLTKPEPGVGVDGAGRPIALLTRTPTFVDVTPVTARSDHSALREIDGNTAEPSAEPLISPNQAKRRTGLLAKLFGPSHGSDLPVATAKPFPRSNIMINSAPNSSETNGDHGGGGESFSDFYAPSPSPISPNPVPIVLTPVTRSSVNPPALPRPTKIGSSDVVFRKDLPPLDQGLVNGANLSPSRDASGESSPLPESNISAISESSSRETQLLDKVGRIRYKNKKKSRNSVVPVFGAASTTTSGGDYTSGGGRSAVNGNGRGQLQYSTQFNSGNQPGTDSDRGPGDSDNYFPRSIYRDSYSSAMSFDSKRTPAKITNGVQASTDGGVKNATLARTNSQTSIQSSESISDRDIKRVERAVARLVRQQEMTLQRQAGEIQRTLQENEIRLMEVEDLGKRLETALRGDPSNNSLLEDWLNCVNEKNGLVRYEADLNLRRRELELEQEHTSLQQALRNKLGVPASQKTKADLESEQQVLERMLAVVQERDTLVKMMELERLNEESANADVQRTLEQKGFVYTNFDPVFLSKQPEMESDV